MQRRIGSSDFKIVSHRLGWSDRGMSLKRRSELTHCGLRFEVGALALRTRMRPDQPFLCHGEEDRICR